MGIVDNSKIV